MTSSPSDKEQYKAARFFAQLTGDHGLLNALEDGRSFDWKPRPDITTYELAICMYLVPLVIAREHFSHHTRIFDAMPSEAQRHFEVKQLDLSEGGDQ